MKNILRKREILSERTKTASSLFTPAWHIFFLFCFIGLSGLACHHNGKAAAGGNPPRPAPGDHTWMIAQLIQRGDDLLSLDGFFKVLVSSDKENRRAKGVFIFQKPDYFYLEFISPLGTAKVVTGSDSKNIVIYYPDKNEYFEGKATGENVEKIFGLRLDPEQIFLIFSGQFIDFNRYRAVSLEPDPLRNAVMAITESQDGAQQVRLWMNPESGALISGFLGDKTGHISLGVHYGDFKQIGKLLIPRRLAIDKTDLSWRIVFTGKDIRINETRDREVFTVKPPAGAVRIPLEKLDSDHPLLFWEAEAGDGE